MACCFALWFLVLCSSFLFKTVQSQETHVIAEKGQRTVINCRLPSSATSVTWQVLRASGSVNASTCVPNSCTDRLSNSFKGNIARSTDGYTSTLEIYTVTTSDTQFICLTDTGNLAANIILDVYVSPSTPSCRTSFSYGQNSYMDLICETDNVYPSFDATPHRRELDHLNVDLIASRCTVYNVGTGSKGDRYGNCTWRIPFSSLLETNTLYVEMVAVVGRNRTPAGSPVFSSDKSVILSQETHVIAEKGKRTVINCTLPSSATSVTWQVLRASGNVSASTCVPNSCTDHLSNSFKGNIARSTDGYTSTLEIYSVTKSDTQFICLTDTGNLAANIILDVYVSPSTPSCRTLLSYGQNSYMDLICETDNVYPSLQAIVRRRELDRVNVDRNASSCTLFIGTKGDYYGNCTLRIPFSSLLETNTFYVEMVAVVGRNGTPAGSPVFSLDRSVTLSLPDVYITDCPVGRCLRGSPIKVNSPSCCKCQVTTSGLVKGEARWYTQDGAVVGTEVASGLFSTLTVSYTEKDKKPTYQCRAENPTARYHYITYEPTFSSSLPRSRISGLTVVMGLGAVYAAIALYLD